MKKAFIIFAGIVAALFILGLVAGSTAPNESTSTKPVKKVTRWNPDLYYDQIQTGQTKQDVEHLTGKKSGDCSVTDTPNLGTMENCSYGSPYTDEGMLHITYLNGQVYTKTKLDF